MDRHEVTVPSLDVILTKNAPSIGIGERFAAENSECTGIRSFFVKPQARKSDNDHRSDCAPVSAIAFTSVLTILAVSMMVYLF